MAGVFRFSPLVYEDLDAAGDTSVVLVDFVLRVRLWDGAWQEIVRVPKSFVTDWASIPWYIRWAVPKKRFGRRGPLVHDFLYRSASVPRFLADALFRAVMEADGIPVWRRVAAYYAVRCFGWMHKR